MSVFDWFKPLDKAIDILDKSVIDRDLRQKLKSELRKAELDLRKMAEQSYVAELNTKTIAWVDAAHKMGRQILSVLTLFVGAGLIFYMIHKGVEVNIETMLSILAASGPAGIYNAAKGRGR